MTIGNLQIIILEVVFFFQIKCWKSKETEHSKYNDRIDVNAKQFWKVKKKTEFLKSKCGYES